MKIDVSRLEPGMVLIEDVIGKSGKPILKKETVLTEVEIQFLKKFMVPSVHISSSQNKQQSKQSDPVRNDKEKSVANNVNVLEETSFGYEFNQTVQTFKRMFQSWQSNLPINMYEIRSVCIPIFEKVITEPFSTIANLVHGREKDIFYYKSVAVSLMSVYLANKLNYEKKDWLQIGFAALLSDCGLAKSKPTVDEKEMDPRHPAISYEMVKDEPTLTQNAKLAILQHHERLDGSGYPLKLSANRIHSYARIIMIADIYYTLIIQGVYDEPAIKVYLTRAMGTKIDQSIVATLTAEFT